MDLFPLLLFAQPLTLMGGCRGTGEIGDLPRYLWSMTAPYDASALAPTFALPFQLRPNKRPLKEGLRLLTGAV